MAAVTGFHHIALRVHDFDRSVEFYTKILGFRVAKAWGPEDGRAVMLDVGNGDYLELFERKSEQFTGETVNASILHFALRTDDTTELLESVRASGAEIQTEPRDVDIPSNPTFPVRIAFFRGPDGEIIELFQER